MTKRPKGRHTNLVDMIEKRLHNVSTLYDLIIVEEKFHNPRTHQDGECDVHALYTRDDGYKYLLCFEIKSTYSPSNQAKAYMQLDKDQGYYCKKYNADRVFKFGVFGHVEDKGYDIVRKK